MFFTYYITQKCIGDAINMLYNGDFSNLIAITQIFGVFAKTIYQKLYKTASKSLQLLFNKALN